MTEMFVVLRSGGWSMWDDETPRPTNVATVICPADDPDYMSKVNSAMGSEVFSQERIKENSIKNDQGSTVIK